MDRLREEGCIFALVSDGRAHRGLMAGACGIETAGWLKTRLSWHWGRRRAHRGGGGAVRVLITNAALKSRGGSVLYARDVARWLREHGHEPSLFSHHLGLFAEELRREGFTVVDHPALSGSPDLIHGQHHGPTMAALAAFPGVPAVYFSHGIEPWEEIPPLPPAHPALRGGLRSGRGAPARRCGVPGPAIEVVHNFVDPRRFLPRDPLPARPRRALVFSNYGRTPTSARRPRSLRASGDRSGCHRVQGRRGRPESGVGPRRVRRRVRPRALGAGSDGGRRGRDRLRHGGDGGAGPPGNFEALRRANFGRAALERPPPPRRSRSTSRPTIRRRPRTCASASGGSAPSTARSSASCASTGRRSGFWRPP